jgi:hypothetical protein
MKTSELTGAALDWAVAKCEGVGVWYDDLPQVLRKTQGNEGEYAPSDDWAQGGPIIEREGFCIQPFKGGWECFVAHRLFEDDHHHSKGPTPLIAAMRCYVASKLGDDVDVPEELL